MLKDFILSDLRLDGVTDRDLDLLVRTHPQIANTEFLEKNDIKNMFENPWHAARNDMVEEA